MCDATTWRLLLGEHAQPADLMQLFTGDSADDDLAAEVTACRGTAAPCASSCSAEMQWEWSHGF